MLKVLYFPFQKNDENSKGDPLVTYELEDIPNGLRVRMHFLPVRQTNVRTEVLEDGTLQEVQEEEVLTEATDRFIDINFDEWRGRVMNIRTSQAAGDYTLLVTDRLNIVRWSEFRDNGARSRYYYPVLNFAVNEDGTEQLLMLRNATYKPAYENAEYVELKNPGSRTYLIYMAQNCEWVKTMFDYFWNKHQNTIRWMDIYSNVTYLEAQVDALTRLVIKLASEKYGNTDEIQLLKEADKYSVLDIKTMPNMIKEFSEDKGNVRKRQTSLYTAVDENHSFEIGE